MAQHRTRQPDSAQPVRSDLATPETATTASPSSPLRNGAFSAGGSTSDLAELAAKFEAQGRGKISAELSGELALDVVLNEIVRHAYLATGADGAAIALRRGADLVCRASSGRNAPALGTPLDTNSGLSGACVRSGQIQRCDDAWNDPRADAEVSREIGVRSVVVYPILVAQELIGILEIFSSRAAAFLDRDVRTLEADAAGILTSVQARQALIASHAQTSSSSDRAVAKKTAERSIAQEQSAAVQAEPVDAEAIVSLMDATNAALDTRRFDWFAAIVAAIIFTIAIAMVTALSVRVGLLKLGKSRGPARTEKSSLPVQAAAMGKSSGDSSSKAGASQVATNADGKSLNGQAEDGQSGSGQHGDQKSQAHSDAAPIPEGTLRVYQNGKEIFRMPPLTMDAAANADSASGNTIAKLSSDAAQSALLKRVEPEYPALALSQRVQGAVVLRVHIGPDGAVQDLQLVNGNQMLADAAIAAVRQWRFKPHLLSGKPLAMETEITLRFTLPSD
jgi:TonB family protein